MVDLATRFPTLQIPDKQSRLIGSARLLSGPLQSAIDKDAAAAWHSAQGLFRRDPSTWSAEAAVQQKIANRLGWLDSPALMAESVDRLRAFADGVVRDGFTDVVLLGMGGSSLAPEVLRSILGTAADRPRFQMVDSTDPAAVHAAATEPDHTLYLLASKSGGTIEPNSLAAHFRVRLEAAGVEKWASHFVAITDEGTALAERARREQFRDVFINPSDIGGRYSALSFFGLVPAALMGQNIEALVGWGLAMLAVAESTNDVLRNAAVSLGLALGSAARSDRDKMTLLVPARLQTFGLWVEQLIAESTGKNAVGVLPVVGETAGGVNAYGSDRLFVSLRAVDDPALPLVAQLAEAHAPIVELTMPEPEALGAEFIRWEIATAVAGALLAINPFDEPNVQQAKDATRLFLTEYESKGQLPIPQPTPDASDGVAIALSTAVDASRVTAGDEVKGLLAQIERGDYVALLAYLGPSPEFERVFGLVRTILRDRLKVATTFGYGPRYLHSTGQLHKGGPNTGVFILVSATPERDLPIPGEAFSFGTLELAQALGDFASLNAAGRRAAHIHLPRPDPQLLARVLGVA